MIPTEPLASAEAEELAAIVMSSPDAIFTTTVDGTILTWNPGAETMLGFPASEAVGRQVRDLIFPPDRQEEFTTLYTSAGRGAGQFTETLRMRRDGTLVDVSAKHTPIRRKDGMTTAISVVLRDITKGKRAEADLIAANVTLRQLVENSPFGIYMVDAAFRLSNVGAGAQRAFESVRPLIGRDFAEVMRCMWPEPFASEVIGRFRHTLKTGQPYHAPNVVERRKDIRETESYDWKIERVTLADGRFGVVCYFYDLSERQHLEAALRESQARLSHAKSSAGLSYVVIDVERGRVEVSKNHDEVTGFATPGSGDDVDLGVATSVLLDHVVEADRQMVSDTLQKKLAGDIVPPLEYRVLGDDGVERWIETRTSPHTGHDGRPRIFTTCLDISERKRSEAHIRLLMVEMNHRAKNLLAIVQAVAGQTAKSGDPATFMVRLSDRIAGLAACQDLLVRGDWQGVEVADLVRAQLKGFSDADGKRIRLDGPPARLAPTSAQAIGMALHELATNAAKYGALSNAAGRLHISWQIEGKRNGTFSMSWTESGGPEVEPPTHKGFGQTVMVSMVQAAVRGKAEVEYRQTGLSWTLRAPAEVTLEPPGGGASHSASVS